MTEAVVKVVEDGVKALAVVLRSGTDRTTSDTHIALSASERTLDAPHRPDDDGINSDKSDDGQTS